MTQTNPKIDDSEQGTEGWFKARIGHVSASNMADVMAKGKGITRMKYMVKMLCEIMSGKPAPQGFKSKHMQSGNDNEHKARMLYMAVTGNQVRQVGFYYLEEEKLGASSDGEVIGTDGAIEIKNVLPTQQVDLIMTKVIDSGYIKQIQTQMYVMNKLWVDYVSTCFGNEEDGELPDKHKIVIIRVYRDEDMIALIRKETAMFHIELKKLIEKMRGSK